jgi:superfamily II DNA or RNA helicase
MKIYVDDRFISMVFDNSVEEAIVKDHFTYEDYSLTFLGGSFNSRRIKKRCFMITKKSFHFLGAGFLKDLLLLLKEEGLTVNELEDRRTRFPFHLKKWHNQELIELFPTNFKYIDHQVQCLLAMLKTNCGIIEAPTSSGKTETIIAFLRATQLPILIIVNRVSLAIQLCDRINKSGIQAGLSHGKEYTEAPVMVSTITSLKKVRNLHRFMGLIVDECHRAQASTFQQALSSIPLPLRFGFSATPDCGDKYKFAKIRQYLGDVIYKVDIGEMIENEVIAKPKISFIESSAHDTLDWSTAYNDCIVHNIHRNSKIKELVEKHNLSTLILIRIIEHGQQLENDIPGSVFISGIDYALYRKEVIEKFENGEIKVIISSGIFNEGISINAIRLLIIASGGKSKIETIQKLGRSLRVMPDKTDVLVYDFMDKGNYYTERHSHMREKIYKKTGFELQQ